MALFIAIALLNGGLITLSRILNGMQARRIGALMASLCNHVVGFVLLSLLIYLQATDDALIKPPFYVYWGGIIGAVFVAINSWVLPQLGAMYCSLLVICGQMLTGVVIDGMLHGISYIAWFGVLVMLAGIGLLHLIKQRSSS
ncbi:MULTISPECIES: DMT family transporter [Shewanella]|uniref:DMT family transporter n=1 Tax=Shewanella vaxholmensis TaxID=3063535 RepID=A0ABU9UUE4_9GAMM|nr:DMT family transporter [Shewanella sp. SP2S2-6]MDT3295069.1 DMT family transporter [Shewanella sp. SP2S2-6]